MTVLNNTIIFGDSYFTFANFVPDGQPSYYSKIERPETDVTKASDIWWHQAVTEAELNLVLNDSLKINKAYKNSNYL